MRPPKIRNDVLFEPFQYSINEVFPTPIVRGGLRLDHEQVAKDCESLIDNIKEYESDPMRYYTTYFHQDGRIAMENLPWYTSFANQVKDTYIDYIRTQFGRNVGNLTRHSIHLFAWCSVWEEGIEHSYHNHQDSLISGTYYPVNEGGQGIKFMSPHIQSQFIHSTGPLEGDTPYPNTKGIGQPGSLTEMVFTPIDGETLMWPSNILHTVQPKKGDFRRIAISFNLKHNEELDNTQHGEELSYEFLQY